MGRLGIAVVLGIGCVVGWLAVAAGLDRYGHRTVVPAGYDAIVVAGCRVLPDGTPSLALQRRTRHAVALWRAGVAPKIVFTGGVGTYPPSEARAAADHAVSVGLPAGVAILEEQSTSTEENAQFAAALLGSDARIVVVTDTYHVFRAERVFGRVFAEVRGAGSEPAWNVRARGALREVFAVLVYGLRGRL
jgi:uncharacterized SAM-binding protein YcdF (DUF218 family)